MSHQMTQEAQTLRPFSTPEPIKGYSSYQAMVDSASSDDPKVREQFWIDASKVLEWESNDFTNVMGEVGNKDSAWFQGGSLNVCYNCVDRHAKEDPSRVALIYEGNEVSDRRMITYSELKDLVSKMANVLKSQGVKQGDTVSIFLPVCTEAIISMLACARIGAIHSFVFGAFRGDALKYRISDCNSKIVITANGYDRATKRIGMKSFLHKVLPECLAVKKVLVFELPGFTDSVPMEDGRDLFIKPLLEEASTECPCVPTPSDQPLFILYTSGSTGNPKGIVHRCGGYAVATAMTHRFVFSIKKGDIFGCTSDLGWITGHSYVCYGPLLNGITTLIFGGSPLYPNATRPWLLISELSLTHFYTSPSAIRAISGILPNGCPIKIPTLRVIGSVGETLDDTTWHYLFEKLGGRNCWIVDTYWQTEMGSIIATSIPGYKDMKPGFVGHPLFGTELVLLDPRDFSIVASTHGPPTSAKDALLCIASPWPGLANTSIGKERTFEETYIVKGTHFFKTGDLASIDEDGYLRITGRTDDQLCINGHRVGPAEVEASILEHRNVKEAAVVGIPDPISGQKLVAFVVLKEANYPTFIDELKTLVNDRFSAIGRPSAVYIVPDLPKTRSEKIIRMLLRSMLTQDEVRVPETIRNPEVIPLIQQSIRAAKK